MNTFLPTKRSTSSSKKTFSASFLRMAYGSIFALLLLMSGGVFGQATLPLTRTTWNGTVPTGWTDAAGGAYASTFACSTNNGARFDTTADRYTVNFDSAPNELTFVTKSNNTNSTSVLLVEESANGSAYTTVVSLTGNTNLGNTCSTKGPYTLNSASRYVRYTFTKGSSNLTMDDVSISKAAVAIPNIILSDNGTQVAAANVSEGKTNHVLHKFQLGVTTANATLTGVGFTTAGGYDTADITNIKLRYSTDANLDAGDTTLSTLASPGVAGPKTFPSFTNQVINAAATGYFFITADIAGSGSSDGGNTISVNALANTDLTFSAGTKSGSTTAGGIQTIIGSSIMIISDGTQVAMNLTENTTNNVLHKFQLWVTTANATLTGVDFTTGGGYDAADISNIKLRYSANNTLDAGDATLSTLASPGAAGAKTFPSFTNQIINSGAVGYFFITADIASGASTGGNTISVNGITTGDLTFSSGTKSGSTATGITQTIVAPTIPTLTTNALPGFGSLCINDTYGPNSFTITGAALTNAAVTVASLSGFTFSTTFGGTYTASLSLTQPGGGYSQVIYVNFSPIASTSYDGNIVIGGGGASNINVAVTGTGTLGLPTVSTVLASSITTTTATSGGSAVGAGCGTIASKGVVWDTSANPTIALGTKTNEGTGNSFYTSAITGLTANTNYNYRAYATNSNGVTGYGADNTFTTVSKAPTAASATTATLDGFTASWTAPATQGSEALTYTVKVYSNNTFTTQVGSDITGITGTSTLVTGLSSSTTYYYTVAAVNAGGTSAVAGFSSGITTLSGPCAGDDFESGSIPATWATGGGTTSVNGSAGDRYVNLNENGEWLQLPTTNNYNSVSFNVKGSSSSNSWTLYVQYNDGSSWIDVNPSGILGSTINTSYSIQNITLPVSSNLVRLFLVRSSNSCYIGYLDAYCAPACTAPSTSATGLIVNNATINSLDLNFTRGNGDGVLIIGKSGSAPTAPNSGTAYSLSDAVGGGTVVYKGSASGVSTTTTQTISGLNENTNYYFAIYEYVSATNCYQAVALTGNLTTLYKAIVVKGNSIVIANNDVTPELNDHTAFGAVSVTGGTFQRTFTIENTGTASLGITSVTSSNNTEFAVSSIVTPGTLNAMASTTFVVTFDPSALGSRTSTITVVSNDILIPSYTFNIEGTGVNSNESDIIATAGFGYTSNIDYKSFQSATIPTVGDGVGVFRFTIRDGGLAANDSDALGTELTGITFNVTNIANLRTARLYDGTTLISTTPTINVGLNTLTFAGLSGSNVTAPDNDSKTLTLYVSFLEAVTDNDQLQYTIASTTTNATGSAFAIANAGGAVSSITGDINRIEVTASKLLFSTITNGVVNNNLASFTITATDSNNNIDKDISGAVALTPITGMTSGSPYTLTSGTVTVASGVQFNAAQADITLNASTTSPVLSGTSNLFSVILVTFPTNSYHTDSAGTWNSTGTGTATWTQWTGTGYTGTVAAPNVTGDKNVYIHHNITIPSSNGSTGNYTITVMDNATLTFSGSSAWTAKGMKVEGGSTLQLNTTSLGIASGTSLELADNSTMVINAVANNNSNIWNGTEVFHPSSNVIIKEWGINAGTNSYRPLLNNLKINATTYNGYSAVFGNLKIDLASSGEASGSFVLLEGAISLNVAHGNLELINPHPSNNISIKGNGTLTTSGIGGNFIVDDGYAPARKVIFSSSGALSFTIKGNMQLDGSTTNITTATSATAFDIIVNGDLNITSGAVLDFVGSSTANPLINFDLKGNLNGIGSGLLRGNSSGANYNFNFSGTSPQTVDIESTSSTENSTLNFNIKTGSTVKLLNRNFELGENSKLNVESGGTIDFDYASGTPLVVTASGSQTGSVFDAQEGGKLLINSPVGISSTGTATGNVQTATRTYGAAKYHYVGTANQITGTGQPAIVGDLVSDNSNLVTLSNAVTVNGKLEVIKGILDLNSKVTQGSSSTVKIDDTATLRITGTSTFPTGFTTHTIANNSIVDYAGSNQAIAAVLSPGYGKLKVSGTGIKTLATADVQVDNSLQVTSSLLKIEEGKTLSVTNEITTVNTNVVPKTDNDVYVAPTLGITIDDGGSLVQNAVVNNQSGNLNTGKINMERLTQKMYRLDYTYWSSPVGDGFTLHDLSPNTLASKYYQWNPGPVPAGNWGVISGGNSAMVPGKGYIIRAPNSYAIDATIPASYQQFTGNFIGRPNNGTVSIPVSGSDTVNVWNLLGNPYPSALDADLFLDANIGVSDSDINNAVVGGTLYFWTHNTPYASTTTYSYSAADYASWNRVGGTNTIAASSTPIENANLGAPNGKIAAGQGFFIKGTANGSAVFNNGMRVKGQNMQFFRGANNTVEKNRVWLNLSGVNNAFSQTLVGYVTNATNDYDIRYDGESFGGNAVTFYSVNNAKNLVIQGRALPFSTADEVPLGYKATGTGNLTISIDHVDGLFDNQLVYLKDNVLNVVHNLTNSDYVFAAVPGTFNDRFVLRYLPAEDLANPTFEEQISNVTIRKNDTTLRVNSPYETIDEVLVYDIMGRLLFDKKDCNTNTFETNTILNGEQTLIVKVRLTNGGVVTKKVL